MMTQPSEDRAAFEEEVAREGYGSGWMPFARDAAGKRYMLEGVEDRWRYWKAALAWQAARTPSLDTAADYARGLEDAAKEADKFAAGYDKAASEDDSGSDSYRARCKEAGEVLRFIATAIRSLAPKPTVER